MKWCSSSSSNGQAQPRSANSLQLVGSLDLWSLALLIDALPAHIYFDSVIIYTYIVYISCAKTEQVYGRILSRAK